MTLRVALLALTTTGAAGDYVAALGTALAGEATVGMWIPDRPLLEPEGVETYVVTKAASRAGVAGHEALAWLRPGSLAEDICAWEPDVVHIVFGEGYPTVARACQQLAAKGVRVAATWHDPKPHGQVFDRVQHAVSSRTMRAASGVHVHCTELVPEGFDDVFVAELPAFPCPGCATVTTTQPLRAEGPIVTVGRFAPYKGIDQLCDAAAEHWRRGGERQLVVIGQGSVPSALRSLERGWPSLVTVRNEYVSGAELHDTLSGAAICVMPYLSGTQSAFPWLARMHGAHLIASDVGCIGSTARRIGARIVRPGSVSQLTDALLEPPSAWTDVARVPLPTFAALAKRLVEWYPSLSDA
jgi:glycosyltransferase involved in cell wall biosynthesis